MEFEQIAEELGISKSEVIKIYKDALRKLKRPSPENRKFWDYINIYLHLEKDKEGITGAGRY